MFSIVTMDATEEWDKIVKGFKNYDTYYLSSYVKAFQIHGDGNPILFYYEKNEIKAMNVVMKRDIANNKHFSGKIPANAFFDITTPYGYGGFILEGEFSETDLKTLDDEYKSFCKDKGIVSEFVRFHPILNNSENIEELYEVLDFGRTITIELNSQEQIWDELTSKNRNVIRKAKKMGVEIYWGRSIDLFEKFVPMYNETMNKEDAKDYYYFEVDFYNSLLSDLRYNSLMFYAVYEEKVISMAIVMFANKQMHYHLSASDREYQHLASTNLLLYEASCWGCENGYRTFHLGGGVGNKEDSLFKFKKAFNKNSNTKFSVGKKIFNPEKYDRLLRIRHETVGTKLDQSYFPEYRG